MKGERKGGRNGMEVGKEWLMLRVEKEWLCLI